jgi:hypothetical protein
MTLLQEAPYPSPFQLLVFRVVLALAAAGIAAFLPGTLRIQISKWIRAAGALAVFVLVYLVNPAGLITSEVRIHMVGFEDRRACERQAALRAKLEPSAYPGQVYPVVLPVKTKAVWLQGPCGVSSGLLRCRLELGEPDTPCGEPYEVVLLAARRRLSPGRHETIPGDVDARSESVQLRR